MKSLFFCRLLIGGTDVKKDEAQLLRDACHIVVATIHIHCEVLPFDVHTILVDTPTYLVMLTQSL